MSCIGWPREADPALHDHYAYALLEPGWAGDLTDGEAAYIAERLSKSPVLRRSWRAAEFFGRRWKTISPTMVERLGRWWAEGCPLPTSKTTGPSTDRDGEGERAGARGTPSGAVSVGQQLRLQGMGP